MKVLIDKDQRNWFKVQNESGHEEQKLFPLDGVTLEGRYIVMRYLADGVKHVNLIDAQPAIGSPKTNGTARK